MKKVTHKFTTPEPKEYKGLLFPLAAHKGFVKVGKGYRQEADKQAVMEAYDKALAVGDRKLAQAIFAANPEMDLTRKGPYGYV